MSRLHPLLVFGGTVAVAVLSCVMQVVVPGLLGWVMAL